MSKHRPACATAALYVGALSVLAVGAGHIEQYYVDDYRIVPTIGTLFLLNFVGALAVTAALVAAVRRFAGRFSDAVRVLAAAAGIGIAAGSLAGLFLSESAGLFGFMENGYRTAIVLSIVAEVTAIVCLTIVLVTSGALRGLTPRSALD